MNAVFMFLQASGTGTAVQPSGEIVGGWEYVISVYVISAIVYAGYAYSVLRRDNDSRSVSKETRS